jgi:hypothetical protein
MLRPLAPMLLVLAACAPAQRVELPEASAEARVVGVALDADGQVREVLGPFLLADVPSFELPPDTEALAAFVLEPSEWRSVSGEPLAAEAWAALRVLEPDEPGREGLCTSCAAPRDAAPALVAPGDRCALPPFVRGAVTVDGAEAPDASWLERARAGLQLGWGGVCGERWAPLSSSRALPVGCGWAPSEAPVVVDHVAEAEDGVVLGVSGTGLWWSERVPGQLVRSGLLPLPGRQATSVAAVEGASPRRWLITTRAVVGSGRPLIHLIEDSSTGYRAVGEGRTMDMVVSAVARPPGSAALYALGRESVAIGGRRPAVRPCTVMNDSLTCTQQSELIAACSDPDDMTYAVVHAAGRAVSLTERGRVLARVGETTSWACPPPYDGRYREAGGGERDLRSIQSVVALGPWVYACGQGDTGTSLLRLRVPSSTAALELGALTRALQPQVVALPFGFCGGFARSASRSEALLWLGDRRVRVDDQGRVEVLDERGPVGGVVFVSTASSSLRLEGDGRVYHAREGGPEALALGAESRTPTLRALGTHATGFVGLDAQAGAWLVPVDDVEVGCAASPRPAPRPVLLDGPAGETRAWARGEDGVWWGWRAPSSLVRVDVDRGRREVWPVEPPLDVGALIGAAVVAPDQLVVATPSALHRVLLRAGAAELSAPIVLEPWGELRAPDEPTWTDLGSAAGVVWVAGRDVLARVTRVSAEVTGVAGWAEQVVEDVRSLETNPAPLVVLAPDHVLLSSRDTINGVDNTLVLTYEVAPRTRRCASSTLGDGAPLGASLRVCLFPDGNESNTQTSARYAPRLGVGPTRDPLLINRDGLVYRGKDAAEGLGLQEPLAMAQDARRVFVVSADDGQLYVGKRALSAVR